MGGARLTDEDDKLIFLLSVHAKMSYAEITEKFGYSADAIRSSKQRYLEKVIEAGGELLEPESNIALIMKARSSLKAILDDPDHPSHVEMIKYTLGNIDAVFKNDRGTGGKLKGRKNKELPGGESYGDNKVGYLQRAAKDGVFEDMSNKGQNSGVVDGAEEVIRDGVGSTG